MYNNQKLLLKNEAHILVFVTTCNITINVPIGILCHFSRDYLTNIFNEI
jgi:hypothetical protein